MDWLFASLAILLPWAALSLWLRLLWPVPEMGLWPMCLGYGYLFALAGTTLILRLQTALGFSLSPWPWLMVATALVIAGLGVTRRRAKALTPVPAVVVDSYPVWQWLVFGGLVLWVFLRFMDLALEVWWQPLYPWDAWTTWAVRARVWAELKELVPFVSANAWLANPEEPIYTIDAWPYPPAVSLIAAWPSLAMGGWNETASNLPWLGAVLALGLGLYGQARLWGASPLWALIILWLALSMPILQTQIALAGYADVWVALALALGLMAFLQWARSGDWRQGSLALLALVACALMKREGLVWASLFLPALIVARLRGIRLLAATGMLVGVGVWIGLSGGLGFEMPGFGSVWLGFDRIAIPGLPSFTYHYHDVWEPVLRHTLVYSNWHLFPYLFVLALVAGAFVVIRTGSPGWQRAGLTWALASVGAVYFLFFWTEAHQWAVKATSINRIVLQFAPALMFWLMLVWLEFAGRLSQIPGEPAPGTGVCQGRLGLNQADPVQTGPQDGQGRARSPLSRGGHGRPG
jgi:hypothetical protein